MPNFFQLHRDGEAVDLNQVDVEMCAHFGHPVSDTRYYQDWFNWLGRGLAMGRTKEEIVAYASKFIFRREEYPTLAGAQEIADWVEDNFQPTAWARIGGGA